MPVQTVAVIGGGTMGSGVALTVVINAMNCIVVDINDAQLETAKAYHKKQLDRSVSKERMTQSEANEAQARISYASQMSEAADADWAIEAATENVDIKKSIFSEMHETFRDDVVLATNTSSISITDLAFILLIIILYLLINILIITLKNILIITLLIILLLIYYKLELMKLLVVVLSDQ